MLNSMYYHWTKRHESAENAANLQPDIALIVGNIQNAVKFFAHKFVLANHSGYFKTLLSTYKGYEVHISNINAQTFAYLLTFMYTGHLDLNALNVYEIFLASNLLHITEALALCRQFIAETQQQITFAKSIVKPIPRKKLVLSNTVAPFDGMQTLKYQPLRTSDDSSPSIFKPVGNLTKSDLVVEETTTNLDRTVVDDEADAKSPLLNNEDFQNASNRSKKSNTPPSVILDVACCDGPIKFRKVINKYYDPNKAINNACCTKDQTSTQINVACQGCKHVFKNYHKFKKYGAVATAATGDSSSGANAITSSQNTKPQTSVELKCKKKTETSNLQCYTCKTCGSKFPSYYFVHKHRKLHHSEIRDSTD